MSHPNQKPSRPSSHKLSEAEQELASINRQIRENDVFLKKQTADLDRDLALQYAHKKAEHVKAMGELSDDLSHKKEEQLQLGSSISKLKDQLLELTNQQHQAHQELKFNTDRHEQQVRSLLITKRQLALDITAIRSELDNYMTMITDARVQLSLVKQKVTQTEQSYLSRIGILKQREKEAEEQCNETATRLREYTAAYDQLSEKEVKRLHDLEERERTLIAKTRKFNEERIDFADRIKRMEQTRQL